MHALIGDQPRHYERLNLTPGVVQPWEDGLRTGAAGGTFEWWYCDAHLDDGSTLTVEFHTKPPFVSPKAPLTPFVLFTLTLPDGSRIDKAYTAEPDEFRASTQGCDVAIGNNIFRGGQGGYTIHVEVEDVVLDLALTAQVPPWRPATGHAFFGAAEEHYIAWLPVVAHGSVTATLTVDGTTRELTGSGYHDHNWGNIAPRKVLDHWYWGRARLGEYTVVTLMFVSHERYGKAVLPAVLVARAGEAVVSAVGADAVGFTEHGVSVHPTTHVAVGSELEYRVTDGDDTYTIAFRHRKDAFFLDFGKAGAYHRFLGDVTLRRDGAEDSQTLRDQTLWELLHFAPRAPEDDADPHGTQHIPVPVIGHQA
ncbi:lipocalin-like domain-containing protein [Streptomyces sp. NPDC057445]|uniref:lipocalin-like domain-containing protein n=1 Tax=Streptomyces sp. NPDC057445 TaxID=3346136 RepID=UPI003688A183